MTLPGNQRVLVIGTGLIGTSIGLALSAADDVVWLEDLDPAAAAKAIKRGAGTQLPDGQEPTLVVVCVPPDSIANVAANALQRFPEATVTDVASVKTAPIKKLTNQTQDSSRFVGGHPMAGLEVSGPDGGRADLFQDRLWAITPTAITDEDRIADVRWLAAQCGAVAVELDPSRHDRAVALTSHTPQVLSSLLAAQLVAADSQDVALSGQGLRDVTRLAASSPQLWSEILAGNSQEVALVLQKVNEQLGDWIDVLESTEVNQEDLARLIRQGNEGRAALPDKHGGAAHQYETILVVVDDKPGELGRLFAAAGDAGVNLEDVRIEHTVGRMRAIVELDVNPDSVKRLRSALGEGGWTLRG